ncbi:hypothetical protein [Acetobacter persici]|nr:hypothetical protein [Acetobacter persici]MBS0963399.1 hypothetical protein [Acetobacter persici]
MLTTLLRQKARQEGHDAPRGTGYKTASRSPLRPDQTDARQAPALCQ